MVTAVSRPSVLVVDGRRENLAAMRGALAELPAEIEAVESGQEALERLQAREFSAAVIDVQTPGMDGFELASLLRASSRTRHVPIVLVTAGALACESVSRGLAVLVQDVSEEKRAAELQDLLLGIVSHDLRTPLGTLVNTLELLSRPELPPEKRAPAAARGRTAAQRMSRLIRDLLDYTRVRGGAGLQLQLGPVSIAEVVRASVEEQRNAHPGAELQVRPGAECSGRWDRERLRQVLENLLSNAVKHGAPGRAVRIGWEVAAGRVRVSVTNEGPEIPAAAVPTLFEPLTCAQGSGGGIGLGLFIARAIVRAHGGRIAVSSGEEVTTFWVELPLEEPRAC